MPTKTERIAMLFSIGIFVTGYSGTSRTFFTINQNRPFDFGTSVVEYVDNVFGTVLEVPYDSFTEVEKESYDDGLISKFKEQK